MATMAPDFTLGRKVQAKIDKHPVWPEYRVMLYHGSKWMVIFCHKDRAHVETVANFLNLWPELIVRAIQTCV